MTKERARLKAAKYLEWAEKREAKAALMQTELDRFLKSFDWTEPIKVGHHSHRRHEKMFERKDMMFRRLIECEKIAKRMREKAENLLRFANTNKGDAEARREELRAGADELFTVGCTVYDPVYREGTIMRVNKKTYSVRFASGLITTRDKSYFVKKS